MSEMRTGGRVLYLDGLRAFAIIFVVMQHYGLKPGPLADMNFGLFGVHLFFALSGFLIARLLATKYEPSGGFWSAYRRFWTSRIFRIVPLVVVALVFISFVPTALKTTDVYVWNILFVHNVYYAYNGEFVSPQTAHFWSLGIEMQFYLLFPLVFWAIPRRFRSIGLIVLLLATYLAGPWLGRVSGAVDPSFLLPWRLDAFLYGAIAATLPDRIRPWVCLPALGAAIVALALIGAGVATPFTYIPAYNLLVGALIGAVPALPVLARFLSLRPLTYLGQISYSVYVWHLIVLWVGAPFIEIVVGLGYPRPLIPGLAANLLLTAVLSLATWYLVERPAMRLGHRLSGPPREPTARLRPARATMSS